MIGVSLFYCLMRGTVTSPLSFRVAADARGTIRRAAQLSGQTMSDLARAAALEAAARILPQGTT